MLVSLDSTMIRLNNNKLVSYTNVDGEVVAFVYSMNYRERRIASLVSDSSRLL